MPDRQQLPPEEPSRAVAEDAAPAADARRFRTLVEVSPDAIFVSREGRVIFVNAAMVALLGANDAAQLLGKSLLDLFHPEAHGAVRARVAHLLAGGRHDGTAEERIVRLDGEIREVDVAAAAFEDEHGPAIQVHLRDITARKQAELRARCAEAAAQAALAAARASEEKYAAIHDNAPLAISLARLDDGTIVDVNAHWVQLFGRSRAEAVGRTPVDLGLVPDLEVRERLFADLRARGGVRTFEARYLPATGEEGWFLGVATCLELSGEQFLLMNAQDITDRRRAEDALREREQELREADRRKTEFLAVLSHELRNPLAPIRASVAILERAPPASEQAIRARQVVRRQTEHLTRLVDDLLDVTRISRGKIALQRARIDLRDVVRRTTDDLRSVFAEAAVELRVDHVLGPVWIEADATRVSQILGNLLQNAVKFTPAGGAVMVAVTAYDRHAELRVRDTGAGMDPETIPRMFEPFVQADRTLARTGGGLGLGLALVKGLVDLHGGTVEARSEGAGRGTELVVRFPLAAPAAAAGPGVAARGPGAARTILVVEDNVDAGQTLADLLELAGHRVRLARDGRSGIALARELAPDVVLCDIGLPDVDGYAVARALREDERLRRTRLVALSGYAQPEDRERAREAGFDHHVAKPPDLDELLRALVA